MLSQFGAVAYRRVPLRPFFVGETPPDRREAILVVLSGSRPIGYFAASFLRPLKTAECRSIQRKRKAAAN